MKPVDVISLEQVFDEPVAFRFELPLAVSSLDREPLLEISPVEFQGEITRIENGFSLDGRLAYRGRLECSRCLAAYPFEESELFTLVLYPRRPVDSQERELEKSDLDAYFYDQPELSVTPIVEERIQLAVPMKPLCRADCRGLCARCGADLNQGSCPCASETADPRWEALRVLSKKA